MMKESGETWMRQKMCDSAKYCCTLFKMNVLAITRLKLRSIQFVFNRISLKHSEQWVRKSKLEIYFEISVDIFECVAKQLNIWAQIKKEQNWKKKLTDTFFKTKNWCFSILLLLLLNTRKISNELNYKRTLYCEILILLYINLRFIAIYILLYKTKRTKKKFNQMYGKHSKRIFIAENENNVRM